MRPRSVLITGASSGIGRALALEYGRGGAKVALCARRIAELEILANEVRTLGGSATCISLDVRDNDAVTDALRRADQELGGLDLVIANAGQGGTQHSSRLSWQDVGAIIDVNIRGAIATLVAAIPLFLAHQRGHLVGISSLAGRRALPMSAAYSASKSALSTFLEGLRIDLSPAGVRVTDVRPGFVDTAMIAGRRHPTPFCWPVDKAARHIARRLEQSPAVVAFPWPLVLATDVARLLPASVYDRFIRAVKSES
ncbi:MAG: SDR family NAD(P)-dependent oxidoreductase [Myxococcota bacterium]|nr:SDR family NAD(P)-dependent oxidoreductase [Myxococcota bacterium]